MVLALLSLISNAKGEPASTASPAVPAWADTYTSRLQALAVLETLNADLLSHDSATLTLDRWCATHHLASPAKVTAERVSDVDKPAGADQRRVLQVSPSELVRYRHVRLHCGAQVLSEADNWYVPARLTPEMNQALDKTDTPFGRVVQPLHFRRQTLDAILLWTPLPEGWEVSSRAAIVPGQSLNIPHEVLQHRAVLQLPDGTPISEVIETYTASVLAFPQPPHP